MITIHDADPTPPFEQIRAQLADQIRTGLLDAGQRLPSVRQLAADLGLAAGTVARAYTALESEDLIETSRSTGTRVRAGRTVAPLARTAAREFVASVAGSGLSLDDAISAVRAEWGARSA